MIYDLPTDSDRFDNQQYDYCIAGASLNATGGQANPTLTIIQLALRLIDHLA